MDFRPTWILVSASTRWRSQICLLFRISRGASGDVGGQGLGLTGISLLLCGGGSQGRSSGHDKLVSTLLGIRDE